ncbi:site-specific integrase [Bombella saccharophila]|uniref:Tyr recombinase domain-containing protein n=1 Tax=Bombella saccharophila TaxID=2967338 RepID=A0ABT3WAT1_9PROT|nr:hypothetical protein [Bombella saccharophila]MCX5614096.1 hypothetical protein [Bombella saccharophila]PHI95276.1 hypothetical protein BG621_07545 [Parasaccharibacter apium]
MIDELKELGFLDYAARQKRLDRPLIYGEGPSGRLRSEQASMTRLNRLIRTVFPDDLDLMGYSFRHHFRQMLSASNIGLELSNKVFGHRGGKTYERYGKGLSEAEAQVFVEKVHFPFSLAFLL